MVVRKLSLFVWQKGVINVGAECVNGTNVMRNISWFCARATGRDVDAGAVTSQPERDRGDSRILHPMLKCLTWLRGNQGKDRTKFLCNYE